MYDHLYLKMYGGSILIPMFVSRWMWNRKQFTCVIGVLESAMRIACTRGHTVLPKGSARLCHEWGILL